MNIKDIIQKLEAEFEEYKRDLSVDELYYIAQALDKISNEAKNIAYYNEDGDKEDLY